MKSTILSFSLILFSYSFCFSQNENEVHTIQYEWNLLRPKYLKLTVQVDSFVNYGVIAKNLSFESKNLKNINKEFADLVFSSLDLKEDLAIQIQTEYDKLEKAILEFHSFIDKSSLKSNKSVQFEFKKVEVLIIEIYNQIHEFNYWVNEVGKSKIVFRKGF